MSQVKQFKCDECSCMIPIGGVVEGECIRNLSLYMEINCEVNGEEKRVIQEGKDLDFCGIACLKHYLTYQVQEDFDGQSNS